MPHKPSQLSLFAPKPHTKQRGRITVRGILRKDPDPKLFAEAILELARQLREQGSEPHK